MKFHRGGDFWASPDSRNILTLSCREEEKNRALKTEQTVYTKAKVYKEFHAFKK